MPEPRPKTSNTYHSWQAVVVAFLNTVFLKSEREALSMHTCRGLANFAQANIANWSLIRRERLRRQALGTLETRAPSRGNARQGKAQMLDGAGCVCVRRVLT